MRTPEEIHNQAVDAKNLLTAMTGNWVISIRSMYRNPRDGGPQKGGDWWGVTIPASGRGKGLICLGMEIVRALIRRDLTV